jgi:hypothetical protein
VDEISHSEIRNIFLKHGTIWRKSKNILLNKEAMIHNKLWKKGYRTTAKVQHSFIRFCVTVCR